MNRKTKRRLLASDPAELGKANYPHEIWSYDLVMDQTADGRRLKFLTIMDEYTRCGLAIFVSRSITPGHVRSVLTDLFGRWGLPTHIKSDNAPEFIAQDIQRWLKETGVSPPIRN